MSSYDITFCTYKKCKNKSCNRHQNRLKNWFYPVSISDFPRCENWKDGEHSNISKINKMVGDRNE